MTGKKFTQDEIHTSNTNGNATSDQQLISDSFNEYFSSIAEISNEAHNKLHIDTRHPMDLSSCSTNPTLSINMKFMSHIEIEKIIKSLQCSNAFRYDKIPSKILQACAKTISLASRIFPS